MVRINRKNLVCSFFNKELFYEVKANKDIILRYYQVNEKDNKLFSTLLDLVFENEYNELTPTKVRYELGKVDDLTDNELDGILNEIKRYIQLTDPAILNDHSEYLAQICTAQAIADAQAEAGTDTVKFLKLASEFEYKSVYSDEMKIVNFKDIDPQRAMDENLKLFSKTNYEFIKRAYPSVEGWLSNQMIMVVGEPGGGKSLFMMSVALEMAMNGKRCVYIALGDLTEASFIVRMGAQLLKIPLDEAGRRSDYCFKSIIEACDDRLMLSIVPANRVSVQKCLKKLRAMKDEFDAGFFDYDSNFKLKGDASMYLEGGGLYSDLSEVTIQWHKFTMVGSQPKQGYWGKSFIPKQGAGESSRKQHFVDGMITIGKVDNNGLPCGRLSFVKNRNGKDNVSIPYIRTADGNFIEVPLGVYQSLKNKSMDSITYNELIGIIEKENRFIAEEAVDRVTTPYVKPSSPSDEFFVDDND